MITVSRPYLPDFDQYSKYLEQIWQNEHLTNFGPLATLLENKLKNYFSSPHLAFVSNGTIAIQIAIKALELKGEIITTPFSFVATTSSIVWENCIPVFADINPDSLTIDPEQIERSITQNTSAILATHVYGIPCDVEAIEKIAQKYKLKVIYDAAHAFGVKYKGKDLVNYGDVSTLSFHATKLFHTVEGGAIISQDAEVAHKINYMRNFGQDGMGGFDGVGINGKNSEFHAAMGLCVFDQVGEIIARRKFLSEIYDDYLLKNDLFIKPLIPADTSYNYAYYPIIMPSEKILLKIVASLQEHDIVPRRYFYPSLSKLGYIDANMPVSEDVSSRVLCLPLYHNLDENVLKKICQIMLKVT